jgi:hypothetical protein
VFVSHLELYNEELMDLLEEEPDTVEVPPAVCCAVLCCAVLCTCTVQYGVVQSFVGIDAVVTTPTCMLSRCAGAFEWW